MIAAMHKDVKALVRRLRRAGCVVEWGSKHLLVYKEGERIGVIPGSPSDARSIKNTVAWFRRKGIEI